MLNLLLGQSGKDQEQIKKAIDLFFDNIEQRVDKVLRRYGKFPLPEFDPATEERCGFRWTEGGIHYCCDLVSGHEMTGSPHSQSDIIVTTWNDETCQAL